MIPCSQVKPQISQQIAQNPPNSPTPTANHVELAKFTLISNDFLFHLVVISLP